MGSSGGAALDFAVRDMGFNVGFITPARYGMDTVHARSPFPYFTEPLRSQFYAKVEDLPVASSSTSDVNVGSRQLAFARDVRVPDRQRVSVGGFGITGLYGVPPDAADFAAVTPGTGLFVYRLLETGEPGGPAGTRQVALLVVQMLESRRLRVEVVRDPRATAMSVSSAASIYVR